jgi:hypothetical protein
LPKLYYCHGGLVKKTQPKRPTKKTQSKWSGPNQLVQNGTLVKLDMGAKKPLRGIFLPKFFIKKIRIFCSVYAHNKVKKCDLCGEHVSKRICMTTTLQYCALHHALKGDCFGSILTLRLSHNNTYRIL